MSNPQPVANDGPFSRRTTTQGSGFASRLRQSTGMNRMLSDIYANAPAGTTIGGGGLRPYGTSNTFAFAPMARVALDPVATRSIGTQTDRTSISLVPSTKNIAALNSGGNYVSFLQKVYSAESERELVIKFQKELGLEPQGLYKKPVMYRQSTQIIQGLQKSRDPCHFSNALF